MSVKPWGPESFLPWVEGVALHIGDPVARLRFLKVATPCIHARSPVPPRSRTAKLLVELAVAVLLILAFALTFVWFVKAPIGSDTSPTQARSTLRRPAARARSAQIVGETPAK
jgi:hypothetical protein